MPEMKEHGARLLSWDQKVVRLGHCPNQSCTCRYKGKNGARNHHCEKESGRTWTLLDQAWREEERGRAGLGTRDMGGHLGTHGFEWSPGRAW
jgi:hypothetical protein